MDILREVVQRVQRGEDVDVEGILGTGVEGREKEWAGCKYRGLPKSSPDIGANNRAVLKEIEDEELLFQTGAEKKSLKEAAKVGEQNDVTQDANDTLGASEEARVKVESRGGVKFY